MTATISRILITMYHITIHVVCRYVLGHIEFKSILKNDSTETQNFNYNMYNFRHDDVCVTFDLY